MSHPKLRQLPELKLKGAGILCSAGLVAIDANASMLCEAGTDFTGADYVSIIAFKSSLPIAKRKKVAAAAIKLWESFASE